MKSKDHPTTMTKKNNKEAKIPEAKPLEHLPTTVSPESYGQLCWPLAKPQGEQGLPTMEAEAHMLTEIPRRPDTAPLTRKRS